MTKRRVTSSFPQPTASEITPASVAADRRNVLKLLAAGAAGPVVAAWAARDAKASMVQVPGKFAALAGHKTKVAGATLNAELTPYTHATWLQQFL